MLKGCGNANLVHLGGHMVVPEIGWVLVTRHPADVMNIEAVSFQRSNPGGSVTRDKTLLFGVHETTFIAKICQLKLKVLIFNHSGGIRNPTEAGDPRGQKLPSGNLASEYL